MERIAQGLAILSFILICWVTHRALWVRTQCVSSPYLSYVKVGDRRIDNCVFESRLGFQQLFHPLSQEELHVIRHLEVLSPMTDVFPVAQPEFAVEVDYHDPYLFDLGRGYVRLGREWVSDPIQTRRALLMMLLKAKTPASYSNQFQLEVMTDFLLRSMLGQTEWRDPDTGDEYSFDQDVKFPTASPSFAAYCDSPFRSLAHRSVCMMRNPNSKDMQAGVWGFRPLLAEALWRAFERLSLTEKLKFMAALEHGPNFPMTRTLNGRSVADMVAWVRATLKDDLIALHVQPSEDMLLARTMKELQVEAPTHWELTVDLTHTPAWKKIVEQLKSWSHFHIGERVLVFTPAGDWAFPSGLKVSWPARDVKSQKHVLIACKWPKPGAAVPVSARHLYAKKSCQRLVRDFWD